jgi:nitric oxide reductase large subunit
MFAASSMLVGVILTELKCRKKEEIFSCLLYVVWKMVHIWIHKTLLKFAGIFTAFLQVIMSMIRRALIQKTC